jgi:hypothetical protein
MIEQAERGGSERERKEAMGASPAGQLHDPQPVARLNVDRVSAEAAAALQAYVESHGARWEAREEGGCVLLLPEGTLKQWEEGDQRLERNVITYRLQFPDGATLIYRRFFTSDVWDWLSSIELPPSEEKQTIISS